MHPWVGLSDHVRLGAVARWVTPELVAEALDDCGVRDKKPGALPARFMVYFTLALALFQQDSYDDVAEHMAGAVPELGQSIPNRSSFTLLGSNIRSWRSPACSRGGGHPVMQQSGTRASGR
jgi:hypothetical protein